MLRDEMLYFWAQIETNIMNEGWASFFHQRIMRELDLTSNGLSNMLRLTPQLCSLPSIR